MLNVPNYRGYLPYAELNEGELTEIIGEMKRAVKEGDIDKTREEIHDRRHATVYNHYSIDARVNTPISSLYFIVNFETTVEQTYHYGDIRTPAKLNERTCSVKLLRAVCWDDYNTERGFTDEQQREIERRVLKCL